MEVREITGKPWPGVGGWQGGGIRERVKKPNMLGTKPRELKKACLEKTEEIEEVCISKYFKKLGRFITLYGCSLHATMEENHSISLNA